MKGILSILIILVICGVVSLTVLVEPADSGMEAEVTDGITVTEPAGADETEGSEEEDVLFSMQDPVGDDWGPGTYTYPLYRHFEPYKGLFDLTQFTIRDQDSDYLLEFAFSEIRDPWGSKYGFSHPMVQLYIDNRPGGDTNLFRPGAQVSLDQSAEWNVMLHITGFWVRAFEPTDRAEVESMTISWNASKNPYDLEMAIVRTEANLVKVLIPKEVVGNLTHAKFVLMVGAFDSFGHDHYREIQEEKNDWYFGGNSHGELGPRILDILVPEDQVQEEILQPREDGLVILPYISLKKDPVEVVVESEWGKFVIWGGALAILALLALIVKIRGKRPPMSH